MGRGFTVCETQVVAGGVDVPDAQKRLISRNVMEIVIPANARVAKHKCYARTRRTTKLITTLGRPQSRSQQTT